MKLGRLAIAHPIYNSRWNKMKVASGTINAASSGGTTLSIPEAQFNGKGDRLFGQMAPIPSIDFCGIQQQVTVGPSTNAANPNGAEKTNPDSASSLTGNILLDIKEDLQYSYTAGDDCTIQILGIPDGWKGDFGGGTGTDFSYGRIIHPPSDFTDKSGVTDPFCFSHFDITGSTANKCSTILNYLNARQTYRLEVKYMGVGYSGGSTTVQLIDGSSSVKATLNLNSSAGGWTTVGQAFTSADLQSTLPYILITHPAGVSATALHIASISLSYHPMSGYTTGYVDLDMYPDTGSVRVKRLTNSSKLTKKLNGTNALSTVPSLSGAELPVTRYQISQSFTNVPAATYAEIETLLNYQNRGYLCNYWPGLTGLPSCLTGRFNSQITGRRNMYDYSLVSFTLSFTETVI